MLEYPGVTQTSQALIECASENPNLIAAFQTGNRVFGLEVFETFGQVVQGANGLGDHEHGQESGEQGCRDTDDGCVTGKTLHGLMDQSERFADLHDQIGVTQAVDVPVVAFAAVVFAGATNKFRVGQLRSLRVAAAPNQATIDIDPDGRPFRPIR